MNAFWRCAAVAVLMLACGCSGQSSGDRQLSSAIRSSVGGRQVPRPQAEQASVEIRARIAATPPEVAETKAAAEQGDPEAQRKLGQIYREGKHVPKDYALAQYWLSRAAEQGDPQACSHLGLMYVEGQGVPHDHERAMELLEQAAECGDQVGFAVAGLCYQFAAMDRDPGYGVAAMDPDPLEAYLLYMKAVECYKRAASHGNAGGMGALARMYAEGKGVRQSASRAIEWYYASGVRCLQDGNREGALGSYDAIVRLAPGHVLAERLTAMLYPDQGLGGQRRSGDEAATAALYGTAWPVAARYAVTCYHVVKDRPHVTLFRRGGVRVAAEIAVQDIANDLALLKVSGPEKLPPAIPLAGSAPSVGERICTLGYPHPDFMGTKPKLTDGIVNSATGLGDDPRTFQISCGLQSGNSGGPVLNMRGEVVGIALSKLNAAEVFRWTGDVPENVGYAVKVAYLEAMLDSVPQKERELATVELPEGATLKDLAAAVQDSVLLIIAE